MSYNWARLILRTGWSPEVASRYLPIVRLLRRYDWVVEVGSGENGIAPYFDGRVVLVDQQFEGDGRWGARTAATALALPFADASVPAVVCVDVLEHMPAEVREIAIAELLRVASEVVVLGVPTGKRSEQHDRNVAAAWRHRHGTLHPFLVEHLQFGLPEQTQLCAAVSQSLHDIGGGNLKHYKNANLIIRSGLMRLWADDRSFSRWMLIGLKWFSPFLSRCNWGHCYRTLWVIDLTATT